MKKFLLFTGGLFITFFLVNVLYILILPAVDWDFGKTKEAHQFKNKNIKILVFGNSASLDGINTQMLSDSVAEAYNFSVGGASLQSNYIQLKSYLQNNQTPQKVLLFLTSAHILYQPAAEINPIIDYYYSPGNTFKAVKDIPTFKFRWLFLEWVKKILSPNHRAATIIKGQLSIKNIVPDNSVYHTKEVTCKADTFYNNSGYYYMWQIQQLCKQKGIQFQVFEMPCWKDVQDNCGNYNIKNKATNESLQIINLNDAGTYAATLNPQQDWLSRNHLNYYGAIKITNAVATIIKK